jgi:hypothetical protein
MVLLKDLTSRHFHIYEQEDEAKMLIRRDSTGKHQSRTYISSCISTDNM